MLRSNNTRWNPINSIKNSKTNENEGRKLRMMKNHSSTNDKSIYLKKETVQLDKNPRKPSKAQPNPVKPSKLVKTLLNPAKPVSN